VVLRKPTSLESWEPTTVRRQPEVLSVVDGASLAPNELRLRRSKAAFAFQSPKSLRFRSRALRLSAPVAA